MCLRLRVLFIFVKLSEGQKEQSHVGGHLKKGHTHFQGPINQGVPNTIMIFQTYYLPPPI